VKLPAHTPLAEVSWISPNRLTALARLDLTTLGALLAHYPRRLEDRTQFTRFPDGETLLPVCLCGEITATSVKRFGGYKKSFEARLENSSSDASSDASSDVFSQPIICRWFNAHYVQKMLATGHRVVVFGKTKMRGSQVIMDHPEFEIIEDDAEMSIHFGRLTPVHPAGEGISPKALRGWIHQALAETDLLSLPSLLPAASSAEARATALLHIHFPPNETAWQEARRLLALEEFFAVQSILVSRRETIRRLPGAAKLLPHPTSKLLTQLRSALPFSLTGDQEKVLTEIQKDLLSPEPMHRLLQGDVGSGKTVVAVAAALHVIEAGWQAALMAPTQILAAQHYKTFQRWLSPLGLRISLRTGNRKDNPSDADDPTDPLPLFENEFTPGETPHLIVGTHALLYEGAEFDRLGLAIIDEQHKFGVLQRARLLERGIAPDLLVLTATPIPRTLTQTLHGDLDVSILREKPANRGKIITAVRPEKKLPEITKFLREQIEAGRQIYIVYPLIDESEKVAAKAATEEAIRWTSALAPHAVEILHGRVRPEEKEAIMQRFRDGITPVLISTTVIEVGVDVPNATVMLIENAERFGLAQLHQLRGRIGRGLHKSWCILVHDTKSSGAKDRLSVLEQSNDGFVIAEADLRLRGPGDLVGTAQTGLPPLRLGDLIRDGDLMTEARQMALALFASDAHLSHPDHAQLKNFLARHQARLQAASG
jgi:ATP-dependent DNA helicase RecG